MPIVVFTDSVEFAEAAVGVPLDDWTECQPVLDLGIRKLAERIYHGQTFRQSKLPAVSPWTYLFLVESASESHYDLLIELSRDVEGLPDGILCLAGSGDRFHGFRGRAWSSPPGNIYLAAYLAPQRVLPHAGTCFTVLAVVSMLDAIDAVPGLRDRAEVKWVNDVLIEGAKVGGVLAYTQSEGQRTDRATLGIGLNVETTPVLESTPFVPRATSLTTLTSDPGECTRQVVFGNLIKTIAKNYRTLVRGEYDTILQRYRGRSMVIGKMVSLCTEESGDLPNVIASGQVVGMSDDLELVFEGSDQRFSKGRLMLESG